MRGPFPDFSGAANAANLNIINAYNYYSFSDLEPTYTANTNGLANYQATPQYSLDDPLELYIPIGGEITMEMSDGNLNRGVMGSVSFQWYKDNNPIAGATERSYTLTNAQVSDTGSYTCKANSAILPELTIQRPDIIVNVGTVGIDENEKPSISIYPNPVTDVLNVETLNTNFNTALLYDISGRLINTFLLIHGNNNIEMSALAIGTYILKVSNGQINIVKRIIKQ